MARAERRSRMASKLVDKWRARLVEMDREGVTSKQARLWTDDQREQGSESGTVG